MPQSEITAANALRSIQFMKLGFILFGVLLIYLAAKLPSTGSGNLSQVMELTITFMALADVASGFLLAKWLGGFVNRKAPANAQATPAMRWRSAQVAGLACISACNLFAFALHMLNAHQPFIVLLFAVGMLALIVWNPGTPPGESEGRILQR
jgi:hypothetical protein